MKTPNLLTKLFLATLVALPLAAACSQESSQSAVQTPAAPPQQVAADDEHTGHDHGQEQAKPQAHNEAPGRDEGHDDGHAHAENQTSSSAPTMPPAIWKAIDAKTAVLAENIKASELGGVHEVAFAIRDHVKLLVDNSPSLSDGDRAKLKANAGYVATLADRLDASGDSSDQKATEANFAQLQKLLGNIRQLYPNQAK